MGNSCGCSREKLNETKDKAKDKLGKAKDFSKAKYFEAKEKYGPTLKEKYEEAKIKMQTYKPEKISDDSQTAMITKFEETLPLKKVTIQDFERRIKKFATPESPNLVTEAQLIESFKDLFPDIQ